MKKNSTKNAIQALRDKIRSIPPHAPVKWSLVTHTATGDVAIFRDGVEPAVLSLDAPGIAECPKGTRDAARSFINAKIVDLAFADAVDVLRKAKIVTPSVDLPERSCPKFGEIVERSGDGAWVKCGSTAKWQVEVSIARASHFDTIRTLLGQVAARAKKNSDSVTQSAADRATGATKSATAPAPIK